MSVVILRTSMARKLPVQYPGAIYHVMTLADCAWSSFAFYLKPAARPAWLRVDRLLGEWRMAQDSEAGRRMFAQCVEGRRHQELTEEFKQVERGWCLGDKEFRRQLLARVSTPSKSHCGEAVHEAVEARAERLLGEARAGVKKTWRHGVKEIRTRCGWLSNCEPTPRCRWHG